MTNKSQQTYMERTDPSQGEWRLLVGDSYSTGQYFAGIPNGDQKQLFLDNTGNDTYTVIVGIAVRCEGKVLVDKAFNASEDTQGDPPDTGVTNKRSDKNGSNITPRIGGDGETGVYSSGDTFNTKTAGGGGATPQIRPGETIEGVVNVIARAIICLCHSLTIVGTQQTQVLILIMLRYPQASIRN